MFCEILTLHGETNSWKAQTEQDRKCGHLSLSNMCIHDSFMPSLHLLRSSYDGLVYDIPCDFWGIVGGYGLRCLRLHYLRSSCDFMYWAS